MAATNGPASSSSVLAKMAADSVTGRFAFAVERYDAKEFFEIAEGPRRGFGPAEKDVLRMVVGLDCDRLSPVRRLACLRELTLEGGEGCFHANQIIRQII